MKIEALGVAGISLPTVTPASSLFIRHHASTGIGLIPTSNVPIPISNASRPTSVVGSNGINSTTEPDSALPTTNQISREVPSAASLFGDLLQQSAHALQKAQSTERAVAQGHGSLLEMSVERARADVLLSVMSAAASRLSNALSTFANMAV